MGGAAVAATLVEPLVGPPKGPARAPPGSPPPYARRHPTAGTSVASIPRSPGSPKEDTPLVAAVPALPPPLLPRKGSLKSGRQLRPPLPDRAAAFRDPGAGGPGRRVRWPDDHGESLTHVREFEPSPSDDSDDDNSDSEANQTCSCVLQ